MAQPLRDAAGGSVARVSTGIEEFDRVLGGGLVPGSALLVGGEPGVGKSTLLLQTAAGVAAGGRTALVISAEESESQVAMRADRLDVGIDAVYLIADSDVDAVIEAAGELAPSLVVVDSIQTVSTSDLDGAAGAVAQVREAAARLIHFAKERSIPVVLVGHVTKEGSLAGPKLLEHMVDVVLYLEGDPYRGVRLLRSLKNRFGAVHQVGLFELGSRGMLPIADPSALFAGDFAGSVPGTVLFPALEGSRPLLVEIQALVSKASTPQPRRSVKGVEPARVHQLLAVLERHAGLSFAGHDVYVNVVGGVRLREPAGDLPLALALASSLTGEPVGAAAAWGEVGLTGEIRPVANAERRRDEAGRLGIRLLVSPDGGGPVRILDALVRVGLVGGAKLTSIPS